MVSLEWALAGREVLAERRAVIQLDLGRAAADDGDSGQSHAPPGDRGTLFQEPRLGSAF